MSDENNIEEVIEAHGSSADRDELSLAKLATQVAQLEIQLETVGKNAKLSIEIQDYVADLRAELAQLREFRIIAIVSALALILLILLILMFFIVKNQRIFLTEPSYFQAVVVAVCILSCTLLVSILMKGVFRIVAERNADDPLPGHIREIIGAYQLVSGK